MKRISAVLCFVLLVTAFVVSTAVATQVEYVSPKQMGTESALVVHGKVASVRSFWNERHTKIFTETVVNVHETYKGAPTGTARILQMGGVVDNMRMHVHGALSWRRGEEVLLFLDRVDADRYRVIGFSQGKFDVLRDPVTGEPFVKRPAIEGAEILGAPPQDGDALLQQSRRVSLDEFVNHALGRR